MWSSILPRKPRINSTGVFLEALRPGGVLFVGGTEAILNFRDIGFQHYMPFFYRKPVK